MSGRDHAPTLPLVLASGSPRRRQLLAEAGLDFKVDPSDVPEVQAPGEPPEAFARRLAAEKARSVALRHPGSLVLGADTIVVVDSEVLGKPADEHDAARMLRLLSRRAHQVITGISLVSPAGEATRSVTTLVYFRRVTEEEIAAYIATGEPMDKAGAYGIQGGASKFIERVEGDYSNVVGLPVAAVLEMLRQQP